MIPLEISNLIDQAKLNETVVNDIVYHFEATFITPEGYVSPIGVLGIGGMQNYVNNRTDDIRLRVRIQPGVYQNQILPYRDNLEVELIRDTRYERRVRYYRCTVLHTNDTELTGNSSKTVDLSIYDDLNFVEIEVQLTDRGFAILRNLPFSGIWPSAKVQDIIHYYLGEETRKQEFQGIDRFKGIDVELPVDNQVVYRQIKIPQGKCFLINLAQYLQNDDYGVYSKGLGSYYKEGRWWVYSLFNDNKYDSSDYVMDIIRVPEDFMPQLDQSYFLNDNILTIVSTGQAEVYNTVDLKLLNEGAGQQIISPKTALGYSGVHVKDGKGVVSRGDALTQYQTNVRRNLEERITVNPDVTANLAKALSHSRMSNGEILNLPWVNGDPELLKPGMAFRYYHLTKENVMQIREGTLLNATYQFFPSSNSLDLHFTCNLNLTLFVGIDPVE